MQTSVSLRIPRFVAMRIFVADSPQKWTVSVLKIALFILSSPEAICSECIGGILCGSDCGTSPLLSVIRELLQLRILNISKRRQRLMMLAKNLFVVRKSQGLLVVTLIFFSHASYCTFIDHFWRVRPNPNVLLILFRV